MTGSSGIAFWWTVLLAAYSVEVCVGGQLLHSGILINGAAAGTQLFDPMHSPHATGNLHLGTLLSPITSPMLVTPLSISIPLLLTLSNSSPTLCRTLVTSTGEHECIRQWCGDHRCEGVFHRIE
jgi:hypothetical protein